MAGGRPRRQSARALEAAEHAAELDFASSVHTAPQSQRTRAPTRGRAAIIYEDEKDEDTIMPGQDGLGSDDEGPEPDLTLCELAVSRVRCAAEITTWLLSHGYRLIFE